MALNVPDEGEFLALRRFVNNAAANDPQLKLYTNNVTPADDDTVSTYTELAGHGYSDFNLTGANWTFATQGATAYAQYDQMTFTLTAACTAYGYFITNAGGTTLCWSEKFSDGPYVIPSGGGTIKVTPKIEAD